MIRSDLQKEFHEKANTFSNWFTSVVIANFVYLIKLKGETILHEQVSEIDYSLTIVALALIFLFKISDVIASWLRVKIKDERDAPLLKHIEEKIEFFKVWIFFLGFVVLGSIAVIISSQILYRLNFQ